MVADRTRRWLSDTVGAVDQVTPMAGSTSSVVYRVDAAGRRFVLRLLTNRRWLAEEPDLAAHEAAALTAAFGAGLPAPALVAFADEGQTEADAVLMTFLDGEIELKPDDRRAYLDRLARMLANVHAAEVGDVQWAYRSWTTLSGKEANAGPRWREALDRVAQPAPEAPYVFIHRDYHPANVLWRGDEVSGVVDWINACRGPAGVDLAHCRLNLTLMYGAESAAQFLAAYERLVPGFEYQPYWDLDCILGCGPEPGYYAPWREFGLGEIARPVLKSRLEQHLANVLDRA